jgi:hypothetical protein
MTDQEREVFQALTDHFAAVMGGPMISGRGVTFKNGVEGIPTIKAAREILGQKVHPGDTETAYVPENAG